MTINQILQTFHSVLFHVLYYTDNAFICLTTSFFLILTVARKEKARAYPGKMDIKHAKESLAFWGKNPASSSAVQLERIAQSWNSQKVKTQGENGLPVF